MNMRHWPIFNGASMAQASLRHCYRRPKEKPMAHWLRLWFFPKGAPMARRRSLGRKIPTRRHPQIAPQTRRIAHAADAQSYHWLDERDMIVKADRQKPLVVLRMSSAAEIAKRTA
jgi:hypothetical protein